MLLDDVKDYLVAFGAQTTGWTIWKGNVPDDGDQIIAVQETGGYPPVEINRENVMVKFQLMVRARRMDYQIGRAKWKECFDILQDAQEVPGSPVLLPGVTFVQCLVYGPNTWNDPKGRPCFTTSFRVKMVNS